MRDLESLTADAFQKIAGNGLARCKADGMDKSVELGPVHAQVSKEVFDLRVVTDIAVKD